MADKNDQRENILRCSARLFSRNGVGPTTVRGIADDVKINSGTLYYYFKSKDEIASEIIIRFLADLISAYTRLEGESAVERLHQIIAISLSVSADHPYATEIYQNEFDSLSEFPRYQEIGELVASSHATWHAVMALGVERGEFRSDIDPDVAQRIVREVVWATVRWNRPNLVAEVEQLSTLLTSLFTDGLKV